MRLLIQRVKSASVSVDSCVISAIQKGYLIYLAIESGDGQHERDYLIRKVLGLRLFPNTEDKLDRSIQDVDGDILVVSQFTLFADCRKGRRPSFSRSAPVLDAAREVDLFCDSLQSQYPKVQRGQFQATMAVESVNDGPFTVILDS